MTHAAMSPVLNVEGCQTHLVSVVVFVAFHLSRLWRVRTWYSTVQYSTVDRDQLRKVTQHQLRTMNVRGHTNSVQ
jgi:hypothetical protein